MGSKELFDMASTKKNTDLIDHAKRFKNVPWCEDYEKMISGMLYVTRVNKEIVILLKYI